MPEFDLVSIKKASNAAYGLAAWTKAMESYDRVAKVRRERFTVSRLYICRAICFQMML
jgi:hypothetical protein